MNYIYIYLAENLSFQAEDEGKIIQTATARIIKLGENFSFKAGGVY